MGVSKKLDKTRNLARSWKSCGRLPSVPRRHRHTDGQSVPSERGGGSLACAATSETSRSTCSTCARARVSPRGAWARSERCGWYWEVMTCPTSSCVSAWSQRSARSTTRTPSCCSTSSPSARAPRGCPLSGSAAPTTAPGSVVAWTRWPAARLAPSPICATSSSPAGTRSLPSRAAGA